MNRKYTNPSQSQLSPQSQTERKLVHVIAHTHWDRSWYWPVERFRVKLVECVKAVVRELRAHPDYRFTFDGQALMLEDYLAVCPEDRDFLQECAREGRIELGPMYCLADVYCVGGEALIRNIQIGREWADQFGGTPGQVLHMPDTFGIIPEMPTLVEGFGFSAFTFMRGSRGQVPGLVDMAEIKGAERQIPADTRFFHWVGSDGARASTIRLREGYASAHYSSCLNRERGDFDFEKYVGVLIDAAAKWDTPAHEVVLLMAGVDHQIPWERQAEAQREASCRSEYDFQFSSLTEVATHLAETDNSEWPICEKEEFHGSGAASVLGGTLSTRVYLKQKNAEVERSLVNQVEPAAALAQLFGQKDPAFGLIKHAWKTLLVTHPHDDICGCSVDAVHRKNESDMAQAAESTDALRRRGLYQMLRHYGFTSRKETRPTLFAFNFQGATRLGPTRFVMDFEGQHQWGDIQLPAHYRMVDEAGQSVPYREIERGQSVNHPRACARIELHAPLPPTSLCRFYLEPIEVASESAAQVSGTADGLETENEHLHLTLQHNGSFTLTRKDTGMTFKDLGLLSSQSDIGDSYDFSDIPGEEEKIFRNLKCQLEHRIWPGGLIELRARGSLKLPASVDSANRRVSEEAVELPFIQTLVLTPGAKQVELTVAFTNTAADHRLRWNMASPAAADSALVGLKYMTLRRHVGLPPEGVEAPRIFAEHPMDHFVAVGNLAVFSDFPRNYEVVDGGKPSARCAITLCRSVSYLTNPVQGATRPGTNAGPHTLTPEARCLGREFEQHLAIRPFANDEVDSLMHEAAMWRAQPFIGQADATMHDLPQEKRIDADAPIYEVKGPMSITAFKPTLDGRALALRLANSSPNREKFCLRHRFGVEAKAVLLDEKTPAKNVDLDQSEPGVIQGEIAPYGLLTFRIEPM